LATQQFATRIDVCRDAGPSKTRPVAPPRVALLLFMFSLAAYLLTGGGHGYSPDGEFAYRMARSFLLDPKHEFFHRMKSGFARWGVLTPVLGQPFVLSGAAVAALAPQRDELPGPAGGFLIEEWPPLGPPQTEAYAISPELAPEPEDAPWYPALARREGERMLITPRAPFRTSRLYLVSFLSLSIEIPQGMQVATLRVQLADGSEQAFPVLAGVHTAEWAFDRADVRPQIRHRRAPIAGHWAGTPRAHYYLGTFTLLAPAEVRRLVVEYTAPQGNLYLRAVNLEAPDGHGLRLESGQRVWSPRENEDYFIRLVYSTMNAVVTAGCVVLVYLLARRFGFSEAAGVATALIYGFATLAWPYAKLDFTEPLVTLFLLLAWYLALLVLAAVPDAGATGQPLARQSLLWGPLLRLPALSAAALLLAIATKYATAIAVPALALPLALELWRRRLPFTAKLTAAVAFGAPFVAVGLPALWLFSSRLGLAPTLFADLLGGLQRGWLDLPFHIGAKGLLFSPGKSIFLYAPPLVLALVGARAFIRRTGWPGAVALAVPAMYFVVYSMKGVWYGGNAWGPRYLVPAVPFLMLLAAPVLEWWLAEARRAAGATGRWRRLGAWAIAALVLAGVGVQFLGVAKNFDVYLQIFSRQVLPSLPLAGAIYGGRDYFPYGEGWPEGNMTAVLFAAPFSPLLGHLWLLGSDAIALLLPARTDLLQRALASPPWRFWGIAVQPAHPEYGLGLDFWSIWLYRYHASHVVVMAAMVLVLVALELTLVLCARRLAALIWPGRRSRWLALGTLVAGLLVFDLVHLLV
jgi:hypothetical protein